MKQVFLSYSRHNEDLMRLVYDELKAAGLQVWIDQTGIPPGSPSWQDAIQKAIEASSALVVLLSPQAKDSRWVLEELRYAGLQKKQIFPILVDGDEGTSIPFGFSTAQWVDMRQIKPESPAFKEKLASLNKEICRVLGVPYLPDSPLPPLPASLLDMSTPEEKPAPDNPRPDASPLFSGDPTFNYHEWLARQRRSEIGDDAYPQRPTSERPTTPTDPPNTGREPSSRPYGSATDPASSAKSGDNDTPSSASSRPGAISSSNASRLPGSNRFGTTPSGSSSASNPSSSTPPTSNSNRFGSTASSNASRLPGSSRFGSTRSSSSSSGNAGGTSNSPDGATPSSSSRLPGSSRFGGSTSSSTDSSNSGASNLGGLRSRLGGTASTPSSTSSRSRFGLRSRLGGTASTPSSTSSRSRFGGAASSSSSSRLGASRFGSTGEKGAKSAAPAQVKKPVAGSATNLPMKGFVMILPFVLPLIAQVAGIFPQQVTAFGNMLTLLLAIAFVVLWVFYSMAGNEYVEEWVGFISFGLGGVAIFIIANALHANNVPVNSWSYVMLGVIALISAGLAMRNAMDGLDDNTLAFWVAMGLTAASSILLGFLATAFWRDLYLDPILPGWANIAVGIGSVTAGPMIIVFVAAFLGGGLGAIEDRRAAYTATALWVLFLIWYFFAGWEVLQSAAFR